MKKIEKKGTEPQETMEQYQKVLTFVLLEHQIEKRMNVVPKKCLKQ